MQQIVLKNVGVQTRRTTCFFRFLGQAMLHSKPAPAFVTQAPSPTHAPVPHASNQQLPHASTAHPNTPTNTSHHPTPPTTGAHQAAPVSSVQVPTYGKPRLLPSPYGPPPLPITTSAENNGATGNARGVSYRGERAPNPPPRRIIPVSMRCYI